MNYKKMFEYLNTHSLDDTNSKIIQYLLKHNQEPIVSINQVAENCFVSTATISRFIRKFTNRGFDDFKSSYNESISSSVPFMFRLKKNDEKNLRENGQIFLNDYGKRIVQSIESMISTVSINEVDSLLAEIHNANRVFLFGFDSTLDSLRHLQIALQRSNKFVFLALTDELQLDSAKQLLNSDVALIVTSFGTFFNNLLPVANELTKSSAKTILITQQSSSLYSVEIEKVINITNTPDPRAGSYCMDIFLDYVARRYYYLFSDSIRT